MAKRDARYKVAVEFPKPLPITDEELALIEVHLGAIIAQMIAMEPVKEYESEQG